MKYGRLTSPARIKAWEREKAEHAVTTLDSPNRPLCTQPGRTKEQHRAAFLNLYHGGKLTKEDKEYLATSTADPTWLQEVYYISERTLRRYQRGH